MESTDFQEFDEDEVTQAVFDKDDPDGKKRAARVKEAKDKPKEKQRTCCWPG